MEAFDSNNSFQQPVLNLCYIHLYIIINGQIKRIEFFPVKPLNKYHAYLVPLNVCDTKPKPSIFEKSIIYSICTTGGKKKIDHQSIDCI